MTHAQPPQPGPGFNPPKAGAPYQPAPGYPPPGYNLPPGYEIKKKKKFYRRVWFWLLAIFVFIIVIIIASVSKAANDAVNKKHTVVYTITGSLKKADISYYSSDGSNNSKNVSLSNTPLPWSQTTEIKGDFSGFLVTATPPGLESSGTLHCQIKVDGKVVSTGDSNDAVGITCDGSGYDGK